MREEGLGFRGAPFSGTPELVLKADSQTGLIEGDTRSLVYSSYLKSVSNCIWRMIEASFWLLLCFFLKQNVFKESPAWFSHQQNPSPSVNPKLKSPHINLETCLRMRMSNSTSAARASTMIAPCRQVTHECGLRIMRVCMAYGLHVNLAACRHVCALRFTTIHVVWHLVAESTLSMSSGRRMLLELNKNILKPASATWTRRKGKCSKPIKKRRLFDIPLEPR